MKNPPTQTNQKDYSDEETYPKTTKWKWLILIEDMNIPLLITIVIIICILLLYRIEMEEIN